MKNLTQSIFNGAPDCFISAAVDSDGTAFLYTAPKRDLSIATDIDDKDGVWVVTLPHYGWIVVGEYDATNWKNSAIDREFKVRAGYTCGDCSHHHEPNKLQPSFCEGCDTLLS